MPLQCALLVLSFINSANAQNAPIKFESAEQQTALLELYTSEGCSSCPPADEWLGRLKQSPGLWKDFVPLAFHVDYWDHLGWRDPWDSSKYSDRQRAYAELWNSDEIYTPCFVSNGREWHDWFGLRAGPGPSGNKAGVLTVTSAETNHWRGSFVPSSPAGPEYDLHAALLVGGVSSDVEAGENEGRRLSHEFVVTSLVDTPLEFQSGMAKGEFTLDVKDKAAVNTLALAVWVTQKEQLDPVQATGGWLRCPGEH